MDEEQKTELTGVKLGQFKKGDDPRRNLDGRPVGARSFTTKVRDALEKIAEGKDYTYEAAFIKTILRKGIVEGDSAIIRLIWNYLDGMPAQDITSGGEKINPIPIINVIPANNSNNQDNEDVQAVEGGPGRNISQQDNLNPNILDSVSPVRQEPDLDQHSVGELPAPAEGSGEGLPANNERTSILPGQELGQN